MEEIHDEGNALAACRQHLRASGSNTNTKNMLDEIIIMNE